MSTPIVSILMSVRNGDRFLAATLASLASQTLKGVEYVIIDDGSTDRTGAILESFARDHESVTLLRNDTSLGLAGSLNRGLAECRAEMIARADADDIHRPDRLAKQAAFLRDNSDFGLVSCGYRRIDANDRVIDKEVPMTDPELISFALMFQTPILHPGTMFRKDAVDRIGGYNEALWTAQDSDLWLRLRTITRLTNIAEPLVDYRMHEDGVVARRGAKGEALSHSIKQRALSAYLGSNLPKDHAATIVEMMRGYHKLAPAKVQEGRLILQRFRDRVAIRENKAVRDWFDERYRNAHIAQAQYLADSAPAFAARLAACAFRERPGLYTASLAGRLAWRSLTSGAEGSAR